MKYKLFFLFNFIVLALSAQQCNCPESFEWMIKTFEQNDAGFQYVIDKKGKGDYDKHTELFRQKAKSALTYPDCQIVLNDFLHYFRPGHIGVRLDEGSDNQKQLTDNEIRLKYKTEPRINLTEKQLVDVLEEKKSKDPIEGIWSNGTYKIGVITKEKSPKEFTGFIIKADNVYWMPQQIKVEFKWDALTANYSATYYMQDHSKQPATAEFVNNEKSLLFLFGSYWVREYPRAFLSVNDELLMQFSKSQFPFVKELSEKTIYLRIPSFAGEHKENIDSVLKKYETLISSKPNLIIDIRNGTGGSDMSYENLIPFLYTHPIRNVGVQYFCTELNAQAYEKYAKMTKDTSNSNYCKRVATGMRSNAGKFIAMSDETVSIDTLEKVLSNPKKVAIICNKNNGSTDEQFLLTAKQSSKVKVFGRPTGGMLDISNMNFVDFPDGKFSLGYCMSKSYRIPDYCIDGVGIQPDYFMDNLIPEKDWIEFVKRTLEE